MYPARERRDRIVFNIKSLQTERFLDCFDVAKKEYIFKNQEADNC